MPTRLKATYTLRFVRMRAMVSFLAAMLTKWSRAIVSCVQMVRVWKIASVIPSILPCGRQPSQASLRGILLGVKAVPAGISNARLCRRSTWVSRSISTVVAQTWRSLITKTSVLSQKLLLVARSPITGCMAACFRSTTKRCQSRWAISCCCAMCLKPPMPACFAC